MKATSLLLALALTALTAAASSTSNVVRVALMNFTTDDNSYRSAQVATDFTSLLQVNMGNVAGLDWVERAQLDRIRQEMRLSGMELIAGDSALRWGRMAKADWLITGWFTSDDSSRRTLLLEIVDLNRADVLASDTIKFAESRTAPLVAGNEQLQQTADVLRRLLTEARKASARVDSQVLVAPLFFADLSRMRRYSENQALPKGFFECLERAAAARGNVRLVRFPRAHQALDESGMNADGLFGTDHQSWQDTANLYIWGTCESTNGRFTTGMQSSRERRLELTVHTWDGSSKPALLKRDFTFTDARPSSAPEVASAMEALANQAIAQARKQANSPDAATVRREVSEAIVGVYARQFLSNHAGFALAKRSTVAQAAQMLDTACFIDPDNSNAQLLRIFTRWGSGSDSKNRFWHSWRRSRAWGNYVERFGLKQPEAEFPFGHHLETVAGNYISSLEDLIRDCPESFRWPESESCSEVKQAQLHGFPKDISNTTAAQWKSELDAELVQRKKVIAEFGRLHPESTNLPPSAARIANRLAELTGKAEQIWRSSNAASSRASSTVPVPPWLRNIQQEMPRFDLSPPDVLDAGIQPQAQEFKFPEHFDVSLVSQLASKDRALLILATDERRAHSTDPNAGIESERTEKRGRIWILEPGRLAPVLFAPQEIPTGIRGFLMDGGKLWIAGETNGWFDFQDARFHQIGFNDGMMIHTGNAFAVAGGSLFLSGEDLPFTLSRLNGEKWQPVKLPAVTRACPRD